MMSQTSCAGARAVSEAGTGAVRGVAGAHLDDCGDRQRDEQAGDDGAPGHAVIAHGEAEREQEQRELAERRHRIDSQGSCEGERRAERVSERRVRERSKSTCARIPEGARAGSTQRRSHKQSATERMEGANHKRAISQFRRRGAKETERERKSAGMRQ